VPNPNDVTKGEMREWLRRLYLDTAATAPSVLVLALYMTSASYIVYGADCGVPCSTEETMEANRREVLGYEGLSEGEKEAIRRNVLALFPAAGERLARAKDKRKL
jgi:6-methylsalicylate decarboxylase